MSNIITEERVFYHFQQQKKKAAKIPFSDHDINLDQGNLRGESVAAAILGSHME